MVHTVLHGQVVDFQGMDYHKADSIASVYPANFLENLPLLVNNLTKNLETEVEKFRAIYVWVSTKIKFDKNLNNLNRNKLRRFRDDPDKLAQWKRTFKNRVFKKLREDQLTVCTGYAYLIYKMANYAGLKSEIVNGYVRSNDINIGGAGIPNHSWNVVKLNKKWYLCDATWSSGYINQSGTFTSEFNDSYFLMDPRLFAINHYPIDTSWALTNDLKELEDYLNSPLVYGAAGVHQIIPIYPTYLNSEVHRNEGLTIRLSVNGEINAKELTLQLRPDYEVHPEIIQTSDRVYLLRYLLDKGRYDVHLRYKKDYIATYHVRVR